MKEHSALKTGCNSVREDKQNLGRNKVILTITNNQERIYSHHCFLSPLNFLACSSRVDINNRIQFQVKIIVYYGTEYMK